MPVFKYDGTLAAETVAPVNSVFGSTASETLTGTAGADGIWSSGVGGGDTLLGGPGDDTYYLKSPGDRVVEQVDGGTDKIVAWANTDLANFHNVENLEVDGDKTYGAGNSGDNILYAGATGAHQLFGGGGQDVFVGGGGADTFIIVKGGGNDVIYNFTTQDTVRLTAGFTTFDQVRAHMTQVGADVKLDLGGSDGLIFRNVTAGQFTAANFQLQIDTAKLGAETFHEDFNSPLSIWSAANNPSGTWRTDFGYQGSQGVGSYTEVSNNEQQIYTSPYFRDHNGDFQSPFTSNPDGTLTITAAKSASSEIFGYHYTSGMISTAQSFAQTYGYFEMRAELPTTAGAWPAFWLLPADGSWPPELDVMETLTADPHNDFTTQHSGVGGVHTSLGAASFIPDTSSGFHTYGVLWTATDLTWFVDGVQIFHTATPADMNKPMFMIANMALGGWSGAIDDAHIPAQMKIDYVHAYALADGSSHTVDSATAGLSATLPISVGAAGYQTPSVEGGSLPTTTTSSEPPAASTPPPASPLPVSPPATSPSPTDIHTIVSPGFGSVLNGTAGADTLVSHNGNETMTGGGGADVFSFPTNPWNPTHITDFHAGVNRLDFSKLYLDGYHGTNPVADGYVSFVSDGQGGTKVLLDPDGPATGHPWPDYVVNLDGVDPSSLTAANVFGGPAAVSPAPATQPVSPPQLLQPAAPPPATGGTSNSAALMVSQGVDSAVEHVLRQPPALSGQADFVNGLKAELAAGQLSVTQAVHQIVLQALPTTSVATLSYEFFTGKAPSAAGMDYLVSPAGPNPNNLSSAYYQSFSLENRYINFAVNLGKAGEGAAAFTARYGGLSLVEATRTAYATIFGEAPSEAKLHAILDPTTVLNGQIFSRTEYFAYYGRDGANGLGTKAAMVGYLLAEAEKADLGTYALSNDAFLTDVALHNAPFAVDLVGAYSQPGFVFHPG
jgi:serralysin